LLRKTRLKRIAFSYDIWCKYQVNLSKRIHQFFPANDANAFKQLIIRGFIPKLHLYAHGSACATKWSLNYHRGVGRTDGESTERDWASAVLAALQTAEMNLGSRHAALDDHWIDRNFRRMVGLRKYSVQASYILSQYLTGPLLLKWLLLAVKWSRIHSHVLKDIESNTSEADLAKWKKMVRDWEHDHSQPDPYVEPESST
jgi:hypothetical protein